MSVRNGVSRTRMIAVVLTAGVALGFASALMSAPTAAGSAPGVAREQRAFHRHTHRPQPPETDSDPSEVTVGERLVLETRFAEFFAEFVGAGGDVNAPLLQGDPVMDFSITPMRPFPDRSRGGQ